MTSLSLLAGRTVHVSVHVYMEDLKGVLSCCRYRGSYMSAHGLYNLLNELGKSDQMRGLPSILLLFRKEINKFNNTGA